jgi:hypothetical protein
VAKSPTKKRLIRLAKYAALAVVLACVVWAMHRELSKTTWADVQRLWPDWRWATLAGLCLVGVNVVQMARYRSLLVAYGASPTWRQMAAIAWIPPLGKYVPGSVWALGAAIAMLRRFGVNVVVAVSVVIMVDAFSEIVGLVIAVPLLMRAPIRDVFPAGQWLGPLFLLIGVVAMSPPIFNRLLAFALRLFRRPPLDHLPSWGEYVVPVLTALAQWLLAGGALWCMTRGVTPIRPGLYVQFTMIAACALAVGYLFFIAPAGMGPRELIFVTLLPPLLQDAPVGTVAIVTIAMRLLQVVVELVLAAFGALLLRWEPPAADAG